jgi:Transposase IS66 family.
MKRLAELNALNLDEVTQIRVAALVQSLIEEAQFKELKLQQAQQEAKAKDLKIQALTLELATLRRIRYGVKSEALSREQLDLFQEACDEDLAAVETEVELLAEPASKPKRQRAGRQPLPAHLPRIEHRHEPESCQCGQCGAELVNIREDITEQLDVEPAKFFVHRHIRPQYACRCCETMTTAPVSPAVIDGGMAAPGLLAWILVSKYLDHLPLYRLEQIAARGQVSLPRSTLADWVGRSGVALKPLAERLQELLLNGDTLHADETPVAQLDPGSGKTKKPTCGLTVATICSRGQKSSSLTISQGVAACTPNTSSAHGTAIYWWMTMPATKPCLLPNVRNPAPSLLVWRMCAANSSTCIRPTPAPWLRKH